MWSVLTSSIAFMTYVITNNIQINEEKGMTLWNSNQYSIYNEIILYHILFIYIYINNK